jgi:hypothetical protein
MGIERPVRDVELEPEYGNYADIYYGEEGDDDIPDYSATPEDEAFSAEMFTGGFFNDPDGTAAVEAAEAEAEAAGAVPEGKTAAKTTKKPAAKKSAAKKTAAKKPASKKTASGKASSKKERSAESDKHEETAGGGFTVKL